MRLEDVMVESVHMYIEMVNGRLRTDEIAVFSVRDG